MEYSKAYTDYYGSPSSILEGLAHGISYLLIVDRVGTQEILKKVPDAVSIWIETPSLEILRQRLEGRATEAPEKIERRLLRAQQEISLEKTDPLFKYHMVNDRLQETVFQLKVIVCQEIRAKRPLFMTFDGQESWSADKSI